MSFCCNHKPVPPSGKVSPAKLSPAMNLKTRIRLPVRLPAVVSPIEGGYSFSCLGRLALVEIWRQLLGSFSIAFACDKEDIGWAD
jgi:hypothetical protein